MIYILTLISIECVQVLFRKQLPDTIVVNKVCVLRMYLLYLTLTFAGLASIVGGNPTADHLNLNNMLFYFSSRLPDDEPSIEHNKTVPCYLL